MLRLAVVEIVVLPISAVRAHSVKFVDVLINGFAPTFMFFLGFEVLAVTLSLKFRLALGCGVGGLLDPGLKVNLIEVYFIHN